MGYPSMAEAIYNHIRQCGGWEPLRNIRGNHDVCHGRFPDASITHLCNMGIARIERGGVALVRPEIGYAEAARGSGKSRFTSADSLAEVSGCARRMHGEFTAADVSEALAGDGISRSARSVGHYLNAVEGLSRRGSRPCRYFWPEEVSE